MCSAMATATDLTPVLDVVIGQLDGPKSRQGRRRFAPSRAEVAKTAHQVHRPPQRPPAPKRPVTTFLVRRYAASATPALAVAAIAATAGMDVRRAVLLGLGTWFGAQSVTVWWGVATHTVGRFAWIAAITDPLISAWFLALSRSPNGR
jgi:hypothetical protein